MQADDPGRPPLPRLISAIPVWSMRRPGTESGCPERGNRTAANVNVESYTYNATGDRLSKTVGTGTAAADGYPGNSHRLTSVAGVARTYDADGNLLSVGGSNTKVYDDRNRLTSSGGRTYDYNGRGERVLKTTPDGDIDFTYDESGRLLSEVHPAPTACIGTICTESVAPPEGTTGASVEYIWVDSLPIGVSYDGFVYNVESD